MSIRTIVVAAVPLLLCACSGLGDLAPDDHVVAAPISTRANVVLQNLVREYGDRDGEWGGGMSDGCVQVWAVQFGYRAGVRRDRGDLIHLAEVTAGWQAAALRQLAWDALLGREVDENDPSVFGFPALLVSGTLGDRGLDGFLFEQVLAEAVTRRAAADRRERAGLAALLAASAELKADQRDERLALARDEAEASAGGGGDTWRFLAWAAIARAAGNEDDVAQARAVLAETRYRFDERGDLELPLDSRDEILSRLLSMVHGLTDLTQVTGDPVLHRAATSLLDYVFSDAYFDGRFLIHDRVLGRSGDVCSGCDFMALYLVDRLYGDSFVIAPLPELPDREPEPEPEVQPSSTWATTLTLGAGPDGLPGELSSSLSHLGVAGGFVLRHEREPVWIELAYRISTIGGTPMLEADVRTFFGEELTYPMAVGFDESGVARLVLGGEPLIAHVTFSREDAGTYRAEFDLYERLPRDEN